MYVLHFRVVTAATFHLDRSALKVFLLQILDHSPTTSQRPHRHKRGGRSKRNKWLAQAYRGWLTHRHTNETKLCQVKGVQTCRGGTRLTTDFIKYYCFRTLWASLQKVGSGLHFIASIDLYPSSSRNRRPVSSSTRALIRLFPKFKSRALRLHASSNKL